MVVRMRHTRSHTGNRRSHHALTAATSVVCSNCGESRRPHHMCLSCGFYNGRQVLDLTAEKEKRDARIKAKHERIRNELGSQAESGVAQTEAVSAPKEEKTSAPEKTIEEAKVTVHEKKSKTGKSKV